MATLEKIRRKSALLLIVIGVALLAFIIGDFGKPGRSIFGDGSAVAKVDGKPIDMAEFQQQVERASKNAQNQGQKIDQAVLQQQVLNNMIAEALFNDEVEALGLEVTDGELTEMMVGRGSASIDNIARNFGFADAAQLHDAAFNPTKYQLPEEQAAQLREYWMSLEQQMTRQIISAKFGNLFLGTLVASELDAKSVYDESASSAMVIYAAKPFATLADADFEPTEDEIKKEWSAHKATYSIPEETRDLSYIAVDIVPSSEDVVAGEKLVEEALTALNNINELEGIADNDHLITQRTKTTKSNIADKSLAAFVDSATIGSAAVVRRISNDFTIAKLLGRSNAIDSVNVDMLMVQGTKAELDSVIAAANSGVALADLKFDAIKNVSDSNWVSLIDPAMANFRSAIENATLGRFFTPDTVADPANGTFLLRVNTRKAPVPVVDLAVVSYTIEPSQATINQLRAGLQNYIAQNNTAALFAEKAQEAGFNTFNAQVSASTPAVNNMPHSRDIIVWALDAKKGAVSEIFEDEQGTRFVAAALNNVYSDYVPTSDPNLHNYLAGIVRNNKKAAALIEQYAGKASDVQGYAKVMEVNVDSAKVNFGQISAYTPGFAGAEVTARATVAPKGKVFGPVKGQNEVVVYEVIDNTIEGRPYDFNESAQIFARTRGGVAHQNSLPQILLGNKKVKNNLHKFFAR